MKFSVVPSEGIFSLISPSKDLSKEEYQTYLKYASPEELDGDLLRSSTYARILRDHPDFIKSKEILEDLHLYSLSTYE